VTDDAARGLADILSGGSRSPERRDFEEDVALLFDYAESNGGRVDQDGAIELAAALLEMASAALMVRETAGSMAAKYLVRKISEKSHNVSSSASSWPCSTRASSF
jgi:hypothetical protein